MTQRIPVFVLTIIALAILAVLATSAWGQEPTRKVVFSIEPGEEIMRAESAIGLTVDGVDIVLVTTTGKDGKGPFFVVRDGKRKGPMASLKEAMAAASEGRPNTPQRKRECASYNPGPAPADALPSRESDRKGGETVQFKGKTFGPHAIIFSVQATPDGSLAYFTASDNDKAWFGCSDGRKVSFGGIPEDFKFSPDAKNAAVVVQGSLSMDDMNKLSKLPPEKIAAAYQEQDKKYLYTIDGKKFGPFNSFKSYSFWFPKTGNDLYFRVGDQVFRNGAPMMKVDSFDPCNFYPSPDGKTYALFDYANIVFSDGKKFPSPLDVFVFQEKGKTVFKWITLENNKDLVVYARAM